MKRAILISLLLLAILILPVSAEYGSTFTPIMTANGAPAPNATSASSTFGGTFPYYVFDREAGTLWYAATVPSAWLRFDSSAGYIVQRYNITVQASAYSARHPSKWGFEGSNDGTIWTTINNQSSVTFTSAETKSFDFVNAVSYSKYRINIMETFGGENPSIVDMTLHEVISSLDTTSPSSITGLTNNTGKCDEVKWSWTNPTNSDYSHLYTLKNNVFMSNYSNSTTTINWTGLVGATTFSSKTVDLSGNINATWINGTATPSVCPTATPTPTPTPTAIPGTQWCGLQSIYFNHGFTILPAGYESLNITPPGPPEIDENITIKASTSPLLIDSYISPQGYPGVTSIAAGIRTYNIYGYVNGAAGITRFNVSLYTRDMIGRAHV